MSDQLELNLGSPRVLVRRSDPSTPREAAFSQSRRGAHLGRVPLAYASGEEITDVEAAHRSGLDRIETTRRASELRNAVLIEPVRLEDGQLKTDVLPTGRRGMVCRITASGREALQS
ncbi:MAG: hypothetical protein H0U46_10865 [Actinobacteria bacterium]|nr:hypothetical protein [Actinomycetota bacterium]